MYYQIKQFDDALDLLLEMVKRRIEKKKELPQKKLKQINLLSIDNETKRFLVLNFGSFT